ncbi:redoxin domain-containing protein [Halococcus sp. IIIV-5B]|uniref:redoxin domain-containing protein n=1 Tax=Halococcus sp. IIIV-5B TaxID=2321230 RepID=UPI000E736DA0|nr:peroxiredoxin [Halococcus sp. IIIV-5B]
MPDFDVVDLDPADNPEAGEAAPDFTRPLVNAEFWEDRALSELTDEGPLLLLFHSMDGAFPATYIWNEVRDRGWTDAITVVGLSISSPYEHKRLLKDRAADARLFSDPGNEVAERYGIVNDLDGMAGIEEPRPAAFVIDGERTIQYAWVAAEWPDFPDYDAIEAAIDDV